MAKKTAKLELVETGVIAESLARLTSGGGGYDDRRWRRALYHALGMARCTEPMQLEMIRKALGLH